MYRMSCTESKWGRYLVDTHVTFFSHGELSVRTSGVCSDFLIAQKQLNTYNNNGLVGGHQVFNDLH